MGDKTVEMDVEEADLLRRLRARFFGVPESEVAATVHAARARLADRPVQDFVPVLVERAAVEALRARAG
jgi:hypothetical protein